MTRTKPTKDSVTRQPSTTSEVEFLLENFRAFRGLHRIAIRPLTILVGENSAGKTSLLAAIAFISNRACFRLQPSFNIHPFNFGTYGTIASVTNGVPSASFSLGYSIPSRKVSVKSTFEQVDRTPRLKRLELIDRFGALVVDVGAKSVRTSRGETIEALKADDEEIPVYSERIEELDLAQVLMHKQFERQFGAAGPTAKGPHTITIHLSDDGESDYDRVGAARSALSAVTPIAPVRSRPRRNYEQGSKSFDPEGNHTPVLLEAGTLSKEMRAAASFGRRSELYDSVEVRRFEGSDDSPFQVLVKTGDALRNVIDVGYGVSQVLPLVLECLRHAKSGRVLIQQPEVHLHPRAQAEMGSFLAELVKNGASICCETHSDFLVDRVRAAVAHGLDAEKVSILFLEREPKEHCARVSHIQLNSDGTPISPPDSYRAFFLEEFERLLSPPKPKAKARGGRG